MITFDYILEVCFKDTLIRVFILKEKLEYFNNEEDKLALELEKNTEKSVLFKS